MGFSSLICAVDLSKNSIIYVFFLLIDHSLFNLLLGPFEASPLTRQVKRKDNRAIKIEAMTPPSCVYTGAAPLLNE